MIHSHTDLKLLVLIQLKDELNGKSEKDDFLMTADIDPSKIIDFFRNCKKQSYFYEDFFQ